MKNYKLLEKMAEYGYTTVQDLATLLQCSRQTASMKLNGKRKFTNLEILIIAMQLEISQEEAKNLCKGD